VLRFEILGPLRVVTDGQQLRIGGRIRQVLLAILLLNAGRMVPKDRLVSLVWGADASITAKHTLEQHVSTLRKLLTTEHPADSECLVTHPSGYMLLVPPGQYDRDEFERLRREGLHALRRRDHSRAITCLRDALTLWRGPALDGLAEEPFARREVAMLTSQRLDTMETLFHTQLEWAFSTDLVAELEAQLVEQPGRERFWEFLMLAYHRSGNPGDALRANDRAREAMDALGVRASGGLTRLRDAIVARDAELERPLALNGSATNLPASAKSFVDRTREMEDIEHRLRRGRLITLTGPPGVGKTYLAVVAARLWAEDLGMAVRLVRLEDVRDGALVAQSVANALAIRERPEEKIADVLVRDLRGSRPLLIILDNCEHVVEATAQLTADILAWCPEVSVLATSRARLGVDGEWVLPVRPLAAPDPSRALSVDDLRRYEAVELFCDRATMVAPRFALDADNAGGVARICAWMDGLPLALEIVAARIETTSPSELADQLGSRLSVTNQTRMVAERHRTLQAAVDWSHDLLDRDERLLYRRLSAFAGGFTLDAAEAVAASVDVEPLLQAAAVGDLVARLVDASLLEPDTRQRRYRLLGTMREHARGQLEEAGEVAAIASAHARHYLALAEGLRAHESTPEERGWIERLVPEQDNLRGALQWAEVHQPELGLRLAWALARFWDLIGVLREERTWLERMLTVQPEPSRLRVRALQELGLLAWRLGEYHTSRSALEAAVGTTAHVGVDELPGVLNLISLVMISEGDFPGALRHAERTLHMPELDPLSEATTHWMIGLARYFMGALDQAAESLRLSCAGRQHDAIGLAQSTGLLGTIEFDRGQVSAGEALLVRSANLLRSLGDMANLPFTLEGLARVAAATGQARRALRLVTIAADVRRVTNGSSIPPWHDRVDSGLRPAYAALGAEADAIASRASGADLETALGELIGALRRDGSPGA
jgi:predicted ATPase/DNA-binding SARP family transcriptional activator